MSRQRRAIPAGEITRHVRLEVERADPAIQRALAVAPTDRATGWFVPSEAVQTIGVGASMINCRMFAVIAHRYPVH